MDRFQILKQTDDFKPCYDPVLPPTPPKSKEEIIADLLRSQEGLHLSAASMAQPLRTFVDYASIARQVFQVQPLPEMATPIFTNCTITVP